MSVIKNLAIPMVIVLFTIAACANPQAGSSQAQAAKELTAYDQCVIAAGESYCKAKQVQIIEGPVSLEEKTILVANIGQVDDELYICRNYAPGGLIVNIPQHGSVEVDIFYLYRHAFAKAEKVVDNGRGVESFWLVGASNDIPGDKQGFDVRIDDSVDCISKVDYLSGKRLPAALHTASIN